MPSPTDITLYDTRSRGKVRLEPVRPGAVSMYVCGPTVYDRAHIGNARPVVVFDTLFRLLRHVYGAGNVAYVRNITDVDDKINARALATLRPGETLTDAIRRISDETIGWYHEDMAALGVERPTFEPRATEFIAPMVAMIGTLIERGHAYEAEGHVLFAVASDPDYGHFSRRSLEEMQAGARVEVAPYKRDPMDFVLWKPSTPEQPGWDSPWGRGRPGWHIECSAMSYELLGGTFDIHGGGIDLVFPHHENEIAQSRCAHPDEDFARIWMHNGFLNVNGEKMSKSLGNFFTVRELLDGASWLPRKMSGPEIRMAFLLSHYRKPMDFGIRRRHEAREVVQDLATLLGKHGQQGLRELDGNAKPLQFVVDALSEDLDTPRAIRLLGKRSLTNNSEIDFKTDLSRIYASQRLLGFDLADHPYATAAADRYDGVAEVVRTSIAGFEAAREVARAIDAARGEKDYQKADRLRAELISAGVEVRSTESGTVVSPTVDFDPRKLKAIE